ncbi:protein GPR107 isoform X2 [Cimex lectularius]|nr:protein GPR107 isoform X2 [Cimex lectularius]XP_024084687.1 protein GPR107 isoform X2 [Cimex lectularius]
MGPDVDIHQVHCLNEPRNPVRVPSVLFIMDRKNNVLRINSTYELKLHIFKDNSQLAAFLRLRDSLSDDVLFSTRGTVNGNFPKRSIAEEEQTIPLIQPQPGYYNTSFVIYVSREKDEGLYNLYFFNCRNYRPNPIPVEFEIDIVEKNKENYLSAGEMPLPALYSMMSLLFFLSGCFWVFILVKSKHTVFKIHYLMATLVYLKSLSLLFHAINYHFIEKKGEHVAAWAILYYITHLLKGSVLFITIVLIGTGWTFIKHLLFERDKKIFMIVIPLQVLANVVKIIIEESEEGDVEHRTWLDVFILVDLLCCGAILVPVVWSIRYLQEAACIDGKAAINLRKLKLFRHFYILVVCYIYVTRIVVYLLEMTVSFQYEWLDEMFKEMGTYVFFVLTGYKFRPASANPYFQVNNEDDDTEEIIISQCGLTEGLSKLATIANDQNEEEIDHLLVSKRESSHEYD